jgi:hypothetical protein
VGARPLRAWRRKVCVRPTAYVAPAPVIWRGVVASRPSARAASRGLRARSQRTVAVFRALVTSAAPPNASPTGRRARVRPLVAAGVVRERARRSTETARRRGILVLAPPSVARACATPMAGAASALRTAFSRATSVIGPRTVARVCARSPRALRRGLARHSRPPARETARRTASCARAVPIVAVGCALLTRAPA